jgi:hypothetical protein
LDVRILPIDNLEKRHAGLTKALAECYLEAGTVCLDRHHKPPQEFLILNDPQQIEATVKWNPPDDQIKGAYANDIDTTEWGAYGFAIAAIELSENLYAIHRCETLKGADYYIAPKGHSHNDLEDALRLEVSGSACANLSELNYRLNEKVDQARRGQSNLPAIAVVVGFQHKLIKLRRVQ